MKKLFSFSVTLCCLLMGALVGSAAHTTWTLRQENGSLQNMVLPALAGPQPSERLLIVSPHPDDETLGCAGLIRQAKSRGVPIKVVIVTNGDDFPWAVQRAYRKLHPTPGDYIRFGEMRQRETLSALKHLGLPSQDVLFLGYPDRGLAPLWMTNWSEEKPFTSVSTRRSRSPYPVSFHPEASYTGLSLTLDLRRIFADYRPTDLYFTHPNDDHPDHAYLSCFILEALQGMKTVHPRLHTFIVHRGNWPIPQGFHPSSHLPPPSGLARLDTRWQALPLSPADKNAKREALTAYRSQLEVRPGARFLFSFIRQNELFGDYRFILSDDTQNCGPDYSSPWLRTIDPTQDKLTRDFQPSADLEEIAARRKGNDLHIRVVAQKTMSRWVTYRLNLHRLDTEEDQDSASLRINLRRGMPLPETVKSCVWEGDTLEAVVPLKALGNPDRVTVNAETLVGGLTVDRAAWRGFDLE